MSISCFPASPVSQLIKEGSLTQPFLHCSRQIFTAPIWLVTQKWKFVFQSVFSKCSTFLGVCDLGWVDPGEFHCCVWGVAASMAGPCTGPGMFTMNWRLILVKHGQSTCLHIDLRKLWVETFPVSCAWPFRGFCCFFFFFLSTFQAVLC